MSIYVTVLVCERLGPTWRKAHGSNLLALERHAPFKTQATTLAELTEPSSPIPKECFRFRNHSEMLGLANTNTQLPDIIGEITAVKRKFYFA
ncbi:hypothetical protein YC2023_009457 [Brassica napus]